MHSENFEYSTQPSPALASATIGFNLSALTNERGMLNSPGARIIREKLGRDIAMGDSGSLHLLLEDLLNNPDFPFDNFKKRNIFLALTVDILKQLPDKSKVMLRKALESENIELAQRAAYVMEEALPDMKLFADTNIFFRCHVYTGSQKAMANRWAHFLKVESSTLTAPADRRSLAARIRIEIRQSASELKATPGINRIIKQNYILLLANRLADRAESILLKTPIPTELTAAAKHYAENRPPLTGADITLTTLALRLIGLDKAIPAELPTAGTTLPTNNSGLINPVHALQEQRNSRCLDLIRNPERLDKVDSFDRAHVGRAIIELISSKVIPAKEQACLLKPLQTIAAWPESKHSELLAYLFVRDDTNNCALGFYYLLKIPQFITFKTTFQSSLSKTAISIANQIFTKQALDQALSLNEQQKPALLTAEQLEDRLDCITARCVWLRSEEEIAWLNELKNPSPKPAKSRRKARN